MSISVLLAGGTGYVGEHMRHHLKDAGHDVRLLVRSDRDAERFGADGFTCVLGDVLDYGSLLKAMSEVDAVINLVAVIRERGGDVTFEKLNYQGTVNLVDAAREAGVRRFIQMSALGAANKPDFPYLFTKWRAENYVRDSGLDFTIFRPAILFGASAEGHEQFVTQLSDLVKDAPVIPIVGDGRTPFQPIFREDVSACFSRALDDATLSNAECDLGGPEVLTYAEMVDEVASVLGIQKRKVHMPATLMEFGAAMLDALPKIEAPATPDQLKMLRLDNTVPDNAAERLVDGRLTPFRGNIGYVAQA